MDWLFPAAVFLWGVYLVWKVDKLDAELKKLRSVPLQLDDVDRRLYNLESTPPTRGTKAR